jgi:outer membrane protein OmpA-like peptidoglycan-associated protein
LKAQEADRLRAQAEQSQQALRKQLLAQFNLILETRDTARGLIVNMSDVLFDFNKYTLRPAAREKLAKISGIILSHPGLRMEVDGYTDSIGTDQYNMKLSEERAEAVRSYLTQQGLSADNVSAKGFGKENPVADNKTAAGRQANRRVEMVVSGDIIGTPISPTR